MSAKKCPDCECAMKGIRLIDKNRDSSHSTLDYAAADAQPGRWFGRFTIEGQIEGLMCDSCGRVLLYARPEEQ